ncbi:hypothetical protein DBR00_19135 [Pseudomonas sp. HMWF032]|uniref:hypothetical protein n=1 Tax=Pseudomonas sp. HMWF032 TaxID=2056866 RepID=UPI000D39A115|nr:hypothetical protein [Pseudomonas sp. HMWF032]PTS82222.1 hypothetical protein DBR00_19135 [Pseudomonas sp. HMWF032]
MKVDWDNVTKILYGKSWSDYPDFTFFYSKTIETRAPGDKTPDLPRVDGHYIEYWWRIEYNDRVELFDRGILKNTYMRILLFFKKNIRSKELLKEVHLALEPHHIIMYEKRA